MNWSKKISKLQLSVFFLLLFGTIDVEAASKKSTFVSPAEQVHLVELFTSEGCSSCPPADNWLSSLHKNAGLWQKFVPLGFHVDYWDYIGWKDRFAKPAFSSRQRRYGQIWKSKAIYTPGFVLNGREWRTPGKRKIPKTNQQKVGVLRATQSEPLGFNLEFTPHATNAAKMPLIELNAALLSGGLSSRVSSGENHGKELKHWFVVLDHKHVKIKSSEVKKLEAKIKLKPHKDAAAVAFWIADASSGYTLQSVGGWLQKEDKNAK